MWTDHPPCRCWNRVHRGQSFHRSLMSSLLNLWTRKRTVCLCACVLKLQQLDENIFCTGGKKIVQIQSLNPVSIFLHVVINNWSHSMLVKLWLQCHKSALRWWVTAAQGCSGVSVEGAGMLKIAKTITSSLMENIQPCKEIVPLRIFLHSQPCDMTAWIHERRIQISCKLQLKAPKLRFLLCLSDTHPMFFNQCEFLY